MGWTHSSQGGMPSRQIMEEKIERGRGKIRVGKLSDIKIILTNGREIS